MMKRGAQASAVLRVLYRCRAGAPLAGTALCVLASILNSMDLITGMYEKLPPHSAPLGAK
jgi:hypothetical protein